MAAKKVKVRVPASSGNLGPGFDVLGAALGLYNELEVELGGRVVSGRVEGEGAGSLGGRTKDLVTEILTRRLGARGFRLSAVNGIPLGRGLGSSAAARLAAHAAAGALLGRPPREALDLASADEGHPDNAAASYYGGLCAGLPGRALEVFHWPMPRELSAVLAVPDFELKTSVARKALPRAIPRGDAVANLAGTAGVIGAVLQRRYGALAAAMRDRLHQPYRAPLVPGLEAAIEAALNAGALGACLSGAGPSVLAIVGPGADGVRVGSSMVRALKARGTRSLFLLAPFDNRGLRLETR